MQKIYKVFSSSILALLLLLIFAIAMALATFIENDFGTAAAWSIIYNAWWFELVMLGLCISFIANIFKYNLFKKEKWAVLIFHLAFIIIIIGAGITRFTSYGGVMRIREGESSDVIISDTNFLWITITDGKKIKKIKKKIAFSTLKDNDFTIETTFNDKPIVVSYKDFIADAEADVVTDSVAGKPLLEMVVTTGKGRQTIYLNNGETQKFGEDVELGFNADKEGIINIQEKEGVFTMNPPQELDFFIMSSQQAGKIKKDSLQAITLRTLYRLGDFSFVPLAYHAKGAFKLTSTAKKPKDNDKVKDDAIVVNISVGDNNKELNLLYREGFLPTHHDVTVNDTQVILAYGSAGIKAPFKIQLDDFQLERYPGSSSPSSYASQVTILDNDTKIPFKIFMNNVLDYKGYRFFQASYDTDEKGTVLSVNHDKLGTWVTYLGYLLMGVGMFFTLFGKTSRFQFISKKLKKLKSKQVIALLAVICSIQLSYAQQKQSDSLLVVNQRTIQSLYIDEAQANEFGRLFVQDLDGRIKPINTLASEFIRKISRKSKFKYPTDKGTITYNTNQTFLSMHISPNVWQKVPVIKIDFDKIGTLLDDKIIAENGLVAFTNLLDEKGEYRLTKVVEEANKKKPAERNEFDKEVLKIDERFNILYNLFMGNYLKIFPKKNDPSNTWYSYTHHFNDFEEEDARFTKTILPTYFKDVSVRNYNEAYEKLLYIKKYQEVLAKEIIPTPKRLEAEIWYNKMNMNFWLFQILFTIGFILLIVAIFKMFSKNKWLNYIWDLLVVITLISFLCFTANIILRWYVAQHAPWSNGYEMLVFVAWTLLLSGIITFRKSDFSLPLATLFTGALLLVSYLDWLNPEITNLMPVLKSYWLKIHVATIVSSYAPLALSAILGLMALILTIFKTNKTQDIINIKIQELAYINELSMTIGLFALSIGTFLGGVWANESWGRYWAWDPKETWALISIIIYAIVLHLRFIPKLNNNLVLSVVSMFAFWSIIMTSFGVNYYLSGLHSYAAGDPMPIPNFVYYLAGFMIVVSVLAYLKIKKERISVIYTKENLLKE